jgi:hypothetical protein
LVWLERPQATAILREIMGPAAKDLFAIFKPPKTVDRLRWGLYT